MKHIKKPKLQDLELGYETGFHIGDGSMTFRETKNEYCVTYYGNDKTEKKFYEIILAPIVNRLFGLKVKVENFENTCYIRIYSKELVKFKSNIIGLPIGPKSKLTCLPKNILNQSEKHPFYLIAGIFDSDGCVKMIKKNKKLYPRLRITLKNENIIEEIKEIISSWGITSCKWENRQYDKRVKKFTTTWNLDINGFKNGQIFVNKVPIKNFHHIKRLDRLKIKIPFNR